MYKLSNYIQLVCILLLTNTLAAQESNSSFWLSGGLGKCYVGLTTKLGLSYGYKGNLFSLRYSNADEFHLGVDNNFESPDLSMSETAILYGRTFRNEFLLFNLSAGVGYKTGILRGKVLSGKVHEKLQVKDYGLAYEASFRIELSSFLGLGGGFFGNINKTKSFKGGMIEVCIGDLR